MEWKFNWNLQHCENYVIHSNDPNYIEDFDKVNWIDNELNLILRR